MTPAFRGYVLAVMLNSRWLLLRAQASRSNECIETLTGMCPILVIIRKHLVPAIRVGMLVTLTVLLLWIPSKVMIELLTRIRVRALSGMLAA